MKKIIFGTMIATSIIACSNEDSQKDSVVNPEKIKSIENATEEVEKGNQTMHQEVEDLKQDIDELLNNI
jgi:peptidoglycan hydrolase CwlO-like protein